MSPNDSQDEDNVAFDHDDEDTFHLVVKKCQKAPQVPAEREESSGSDHEDDDTNAPVVKKPHLLQKALQIGTGEIKQPDEYTFLIGKGKKFSEVMKSQLAGWDPSLLHAE